MSPLSGPGMTEEKRHDRCLIREFVPRGSSHCVSLWSHLFSSKNSVHLISGPNKFWYYESEPGTEPNYPKQITQQLSGYRVTVEAMLAYDSLHPSTVANVSQFCSTLLGPLSRRSNGVA